MRVREIGPMSVSILVEDVDFSSEITLADFQRGETYACLIDEFMIAARFPITIKHILP